MYLCLDLSLKCSGFAKFNKNGRLMKKGRIIPSKDLSNCMKIHFITTKIKELFPNVEALIIEDLYYGKNFASIKWLARLSGAVLSEWVDYSYKAPKFYMASTARKLAGINARSQKAEIQLFILDKYKFASKTKIKNYHTEIIKLKIMLENEEIKRSTYKSRMNKLSNVIDKETNLGNDLADAILLGLAYQEDKNKCRNY